MSESSSPQPAAPGAPRAGVGAQRESKRKQNVALDDPSVAAIAGNGNGNANGNDAVSSDRKKQKK